MLWSWRKTQLLGVRNKCLQRRPQQVSPTTSAFTCYKTTTTRCSSFSTKMDHTEMDNAEMRPCIPREDCARWGLPRRDSSSPLCVRFPCETTVETSLMHLGSDQSRPSCLRWESSPTPFDSLFPNFFREGSGMVPPLIAQREEARKRTSQRWTTWRRTGSGWVRGAGVVTACLSPRCPGFDLYLLLPL